MYGEPLSLEQRQRLPRLYAQVAYEPVRALDVVPIVYFEALALAAFFPVVWRREGVHFELVTLRALSGAVRVTAETALPLLLRAFPFRNMEAGWERMVPAIDSTPPDDPRDIGAPVFNAAGEFTLGAMHRVRSLVLFARNIGETQEMVEALAALDMLVPWNLKERVAEAADLPHDLYAAKDPRQMPQVAEFVARFRQKGANLLSAHRLSLYRTSALLSAGKKPVAHAG